MQFVSGDIIISREIGFAPTDPHQDLQRRCFGINIIEITDLAHDGLEAYVDLTNIQLRNTLKPLGAIFIAESPKVIEYALLAGYEPVSLLTERRGLAKIERIRALPNGIPIYTGDREILAELTGFELTRGILCAMKRKPLPSAADIAIKAKRAAFLDGIVDPTNVGAIFRSAAALGADAVFVSDTCCDPLLRRSIRVSMGSVFSVPWTVLPHGAAGVSALSGFGFTTAAMALSADPASICDTRLKTAERLALVFGTEGDGLSEAAIGACDMTVMIPMSNGIDSLNVAASAALAFWETRRQ